MYKGLSKYTWGSSAIELFEVNPEVNPKATYTFVNQLSTGNKTVVRTSLV